MTVLSVVVHGTPGAQGSKRGFVARGRVVMVETNVRTKSWRSDVKAAAETAITEWEQHRPLDAGVARTWKPLNGPVAVIVTFQFARPASHCGTGRNADKLRANAPLYPTGNHGDVEKLVRATHDALTAAGVWTDDKLVVHLNALKRWCQDGERPGASIRIEALTC